MAEATLEAAEKNQAGIKGVKGRSVHQLAPGKTPLAAHLGPIDAAVELLLGAITSLAVLGFQLLDACLRVQLPT